MAVQWNASDATCGVWKHCLAVSCDGPSNVWRVLWDGDAAVGDGTQQLTPCHRLHLCFTAEDPVNCANRIAFAHASRRRAEAYLRSVCVRVRVCACACVYVCLRVCVRV